MLSRKVSFGTILVLILLVWRRIQMTPTASLVSNTSSSSSTVAISSSSSSSSIWRMFSSSKTGGRNTCPAPFHPSPPVTRKEFPRAYKLSLFVRGVGLEEWHDPNVTEATCKFERSGTQRDALHLPHTMQQLYQCFSWWHANPEKQAVLLTGPIESQTPYTKGYLQMLQDVFRVKLVSKREGRHPVRPVVDYTYHGETPNGGYRMRGPADFNYLRKAVKYYYRDVFQYGGCPRARKQSQTSAQGKASKSNPSLQPVITILNREKMSGRHLLDATKLQSTLQHAFPQATVQYVPSMDGKTFLEQVEIFAGTDVFLSPHGAQWTGIPFLPNCAHTLEIFPPDYVVPKFYGSLVAAAGHHYSFLMSGLQDSYNRTALLLDSTTNQTTVALNERRRARSSSICITESGIREQMIPALQEMIHKWERCCS